MSRKKAAEFFAGIGLVRLALEKKGWDVVFANDNNPLKFQMYRQWFGEEDFYPCSIERVSSKLIPDVSLATASFPCIDLSLAGNRNGLGGSHSSVYWEFYRILKEMKARRPPTVLLENVVGLLTSAGGRDLRSIILSLNRLGYACDLLIVDAVHFVPQSRPRLFVLGFLDSSGRKSYAPTLHDARPKKVLEFIFKNTDLGWTHVSLPPLPGRKASLADFLERLDTDAREWWERGRQNHLHAQMSALHKAKLRELVGKRSLSYATVYRRIRPDGCRAELRTDSIAGCLRTPRGGSSKQFLIEAGKGEWRVRNMTPREYARLQGVPDSYKIQIPYNQALLGFGDAVCVPVVEWVLERCEWQQKRKAA